MEEIADVSRTCSGTRRNRLETFRAPKRIFSWRKYFYVSFNVPKMAATSVVCCLPSASTSTIPPSHPIYIYVSHPKLCRKLLGPT